MADFIENTIGVYTLCAAIGLLLLVIVYFLLGRRRCAGRWQLFSMLIFALAGLLIGAHLLFFIVGLPDWIAQYAGKINTLAEFIDAFAYGASGLVFYGGLLGAYGGILIFCRIYRFHPHPELNHATVVFPLFHCAGRIGCLLNGCCYGIEYHGPLAILYDASHIVAGKSDDLADFSRFPVQGLEALAELIIFVFLLILYIKTRDRYSIASIYLLIYAAIRFADEFLRGDAIRKIWGPFSTSQWISLAIIVGVGIFLITRQKRSPQKKLFEAC